MIKLQVPNVNSPIGRSRTEFTVISPEWQRFLTLVAAAIKELQTASPDAMRLVYAGATAPDGWEKDLTGGLPVLPAGYIWIKKGA